MRSRVQFLAMYFIFKKLGLYVDGIIPLQRLTACFTNQPMQRFGGIVMVRTKLQRMNQCNGLNQLTSLKDAIQQ